MFDCSDCDRYECQMEDTERPKHEPACFYSYSRSRCMVKTGIRQAFQKKSAYFGTSAKLGGGLRKPNYFYLEIRTFCKGGGVGLQPMS